MFVTAGFIVGFDSERGSVAEPMIELIEEAAIPIAMVGLLYALPNTQLTRRLAREGRLHVDHDSAPAGKGDQCTAGVNYQTKRSRLDILRDYQGSRTDLRSRCVLRPFGTARRHARLYRSAEGIARGRHQAPALHYQHGS
jgi:hypothetical protein